MSYAPINVSPLPRPSGLYGGFDIPDIRYSIVHVGQTEYVKSPYTRLHILNLQKPLSMSLSSGALNKLIGALIY